LATKFSFRASIKSAKSSFEATGDPPLLAFAILNAPNRHNCFVDRLCTVIRRDKFKGLSCYLILNDQPDLEYSGAPAKIPLPAAASVLRLDAVKPEVTREPLTPAGSGP